MKGFTKSIILVLDLAINCNLELLLPWIYLSNESLKAVTLSNFVKFILILLNIILCKVTIPKYERIESYVWQQKKIIKQCLLNFPKVTVMT